VWVSVEEPGNVSMGSLRVRIIPCPTGWPDGAVIGIRALALNTQR